MFFSHQLEALTSQSGTSCLRRWVMDSMKKIKPTENALNWSLAEWMSWISDLKSELPRNHARLVFFGGGVIKDAVDALGGLWMFWPWCMQKNEVRGYTGVSLKRSTGYGWAKRFKTQRRIWDIHHLEWYNLPMEVSCAAKLMTEGTMRVASQSCVYLFNC